MCVCVCFPSFLVQVHDDWWGMWGVCGEVTRELLQRALPDDISILNGRLHVSVTVMLPYPHNGEAALGAVHVMCCTRAHTHVLTYTAVPFA